MFEPKPSKPQTPDGFFDERALKAFPERMLYYLCSSENKERCQFFCQGMLVTEPEQFLCHLCNLLGRLCVRW